jgi:dTDP-4-dehydrorhamnose reductase
MIRKNILLIGSSGQLGSNLIQALLKLKKYKIIEGHKNKINLININNLENKIKKIKPLMIINCAAFTNVDLCEKKKNLAKKLNFYCIKKLARICYKNNIKLIHFSTDYVYGSKRAYYKETDHCQPLNYYGKTKYLGDRSIINANIKFLIFRISFLLSNHHKSFVYKIKKQLIINKKCKVISNSYTSPTTVQFISKFFIYNFSKIINDQITGVFNLRNSQVVSYYQVAKQIQKYLHKKNLISECNYDEFQTIAKRPKYSKLNISKLKKYFKIPSNDWKKEIKNFL